MSPDDIRQDEALDAELRNVSVPEGMVARLRQIAGPSDEEMDRALRDVPVPLGFIERLRRIARRPSPRVWLRRVALAASILVGLWLSYAGAIVASMIMFSNPPAPPPEPSKIVQLPDLLPAINPPKEKLEVDRSFSGWVPRDDLAAFDPKRSAPEVRPDHPKPSLSPLEETERLLAGAETGRFDPLLDANLTRWKDIASSHPALYDLPELRTAAVAGPRGIEACRSPGYNIAVLTRWGVHPLVSPAIDPRLQVSEVPMGIDPASYELARRCVENGELPRRDDLHTEDFLAAIQYDFPRPTGAPIAVHAMGGPSPFRADGRSLFQIGVQARDDGDARHPITRLTLAVDISASTQWGGRLDMVRRALVRLLDQLSPEDRVSLVAFSEEAYVLLDDAPASARSSLLAAIQSLQPQRSTNLGAGLRSAYAVALQSKKAVVGTNRVVLLTDGLVELDRSTVWRIERRLMEAAEEGVRLDVIDLGQQEAREEEASLARFARAASGQIYRAQGENDVYWALLEILHGRPTLVARDARLKVVFNPKAVAAYRLVGHESRAFGSLRTAKLEADLHVGQSAVAVYEIFLALNGEAEVARAEVTWIDPQGSQTHSAAIAFRREHFAPLWTQTPWQVQAAAIAAEAAETLRGLPEVLPLSPFARPRTGATPLNHVLRVARELDSPVRSRPSVTEFIETLRRMDGLKPSKGGGRR